MAYLLSDTEIWFPKPDMADDEGLLAVGGDLSAERLLLAYHHGIFPWYSDETPVLWYSPDPRFVLLPGNLKISKSMRKLMKNAEFRITHNQAFARVIQSCAATPRAGQPGTWITGYSGVC